MNTFQWFQISIKQDGLVMEGEQLASLAHLLHGYLLFCQSGNYSLQRQLSYNCRLAQVFDSGTYKNVQETFVIFCGSAQIFRYRIQIFFRRNPDYHMYAMSIALLMWSTYGSESLQSNLSIGIEVGPNLALLIIC